MKPFKNISFVGLFLTILFIGQTGCQGDLLDEQPLAQLSEASFWNSESDAKLALTGVYNGSNVGTNAYNNELLIMASFTDDSGYKHGAVGVIYSGYLQPSDAQVVRAIWTRAYRTIFKANYFLENIERVEMDPASGRVSVLPPLSRPGDYLRLRAQMPLVVAMTACSAGQSNNFSYKPIDFRVERAAAAGRNAMSAPG